MHTATDRQNGWLAAIHLQLHGKGNEKDLQVSGSIWSSIIMMHIPRSSLPRRPALPLIWMYSPLDMYLHSPGSSCSPFDSDAKEHSSDAMAEPSVRLRACCWPDGCVCISGSRQQQQYWGRGVGWHLVPSPSNLLMAVKTTVRAGMLRPMAKVSVAKRACSMPSGFRPGSAKRYNGVYLLCPLQPPNKYAQQAQQHSWLGQLSNVLDTEECLLMRSLCTDQNCYKPECTRGRGSRRAKGF